MPNYIPKEVSILNGKVLTLIGVDRNNNEILFIVSNTERYVMLHTQDCCENVTIKEIEGELSDLLDTPILSAVESTNRDDISEGMHEINESFTWTFYRFTTIKGTVVITWLGESNGYYSESVEFYLLKEK